MSKRKGKAWFGERNQFKVEKVPQQGWCVFEWNKRQRLWEIVQMRVGRAEAWRMAEKMAGGPTPKK